MDWKIMAHLDYGDFRGTNYLEVSIKFLQLTCWLQPAHTMIERERCKTHAILASTIQSLTSSESMHCCCLCESVFF